MLLVAWGLARFAPTGSADPLQSRRDFESAKLQAKRAAQMSERARRATAKVDALKASQQAQGERLKDLEAKIVHLRGVA